MIVMALCILFLAFVLARKGLRYTLCLMPGIFLFVAAEAYISDMLTPASYPGDFLDMFLPFVTIPAHFFLALVSIGLALFLSKHVLRLVYKKPDRQSVRPFLNSAPRLVAVTLLTLTGISLIILDFNMPRLMRERQRQSEEVAFARASDAISAYSQKQANEETFLRAMEDLPREVSCVRSFAPDVEKLLQQGETAKAATLVRALGRSCVDSPTLDNLVRTRQRDGTIRELNTLLAIGLATHSKPLDEMARYALSSQNDDDFLALLTHFLDAREKEGPSPSSSDGLRTLLLMLAEKGPATKELLSRFFVRAGQKPLQYLFPDDFDTISRAFLGSAADNLRPDLLQFYIDMGFTRELTRYGSTLSSFVYAHGGSAIIQRLIDAGAEVNSVTAQGFTPLLMLLWQPEMDRKPYDPEREQRAVETFDLLFALNDHRLYVMPDGGNLLHRACAAGRYSPQGIAEIGVLLKAGADPALSGSGLPSPADVAEKYGWNQARALLLQAQKR